MNENFIAIKLSSLAQGHDLNVRIDVSRKLNQIRGEPIWLVRKRKAENKFFIYKFNESFR